MTNNEDANFERDCLNINEDNAAQSRRILQTFGCWRQVRANLTNFVKFRDFDEQYLGLL